MTDVQASITSLQQSPTKAGKPRWLVGLSTGLTVTIWDAALADKASKIPQGALAGFSYESKQNGDWLNHTLKDIVYTGQTVAAAPISVTSPSGGIRPLSDEDKKRVTFLSIFSSVANLYSGSGDVEGAWAAAVAQMEKIFPKPVEAPVVALVPAPVTLDEEIQSGAVQTSDALPWD